MSLRYIRVFSFVLLLSLLTSCALPGLSAPTPTLAPTNTPEPSATSSPTNTLEPTVTFTEAPSLTPTIMPTIEPMLAVAKTSITLRSRPSKGGDNVGGVYGNEKVKVIARNIPATWFYIIAPDAPGGMAWVLAAGFTLQGDLTQLPIAMFPEGSTTPLLLPPIIHTISGTPLPLNPPAPGAQTATVTQLAKVRVGPGLGYMEMGLLDVGTVVVVTGRIKGNSWLQIEYPSGLDGRGWVLAELVKFEGDFGGMPFFNQLATNIPKEDEAAEQPAATETLSVDVTPVDTPIPFTETPALPMGITLAQVNARSGPASSFASYGLLEKNQPVTILGRTLNGIWFQIQYPAAPNGVAWVAAEYVQVMKSIEGIPYFDNSGTPLPTP